MPENQNADSLNPDLVKILKQTDLASSLIKDMESSSEFIEPLWVRAKNIATDQPSSTFKSAKSKDHARIWLIKNLLSKPVAIPQIIYGWRDLCLYSWPEEEKYQTGAPWKKILIRHMIGLKAGLKAHLFPSDAQTLAVLTEPSGRNYNSRVWDQAYDLALTAIVLQSSGQEILKTAGALHKRFKDSPMATIAEALDFYTGITDDEAANTKKSLSLSCKIMHTKLSLAAAKGRLAFASDLAGCAEEKFPKLLLEKYDEWISELDESLEAIQDNVWSFQGIAALVRSIDPPLKDKDNKTLEQILAGLNENEFFENLAAQAPILDILIRHIEAGTSPTDEEMGLLKDEFTGNFIDKIAKGLLRFKKSPGEEPQMDNGSTEIPVPPEPKTAPGPQDDKTRAVTEKQTGQVSSEETIKAPETSTAPVKQEDLPAPLTEYDPTTQDMSRPGHPELVPEAPKNREVFRPPILRKLLIEQRAGEIFWLMKSSPEPAIPVWLAELLYLGSRLQPGFNLSMTRIKTLIADRAIPFISEGPPSENHGLLLAAGLIRPVLMMPGPDHQYPLRELEQTLRPYKCLELMERLGDFAVKCIPLDDAIFKDLGRQSQSKEHREELERRTNELLTTTAFKKILYQRATVVLKELFSHRGEIGQALYACLENDHTVMEECLKKNWQDKTFLRKIVNDLDERISKPQKAKEIDFRAFDGIQRNVQAALDLLEEWRQLSLRKDNQDASGFSHKQLSEISELAAKAELPGDNPYTGFLQARLSELTSKFANITASETALDPYTVLKHWPMILKNSLPLDNDFKIEESDLLYFLEKFSEDKQGTLLRESLRRHIKQGHFKAAEEYLKLFPSQKTPEIESFLDENYGLWRNKLTELAARIQVAVVDAHLRGVIQETRENDLKREIEDILNNPDRQRLSSAVADLELIKTGLDEEEIRQKNEVQQTFDSLAADLPDDSADYIKSLMAQGEYGLAIDALAQANTAVTEHSDFPKKPIETPSRLLAVEEFFALLRKDEIPDLKPSRRHEVDEVSAWQSLAVSKGAKESHHTLGQLTEIFRWLGFVLDLNVTPITILNEASPTWWRVSNYDMSITSPLPQWGTQAAQHTIVFGWPTADKYPEYLLQLLKNLINDTRKGLSKKNAITVLYFNKLSYEARMRIIRECRKLDYLPLIIDTNLFNWLHGRTSRTEDLFAIGLAGSPYNPYVPFAAAALPREMFFGRLKDIDDLWDPLGTCIVYGGRQLGKSALLAQVKDRYGNEKSDHYVFLHSMSKTESSFIDAAIRELSKIEALKDLKPKKLLDQVKAFLDEKPTRRILLLFDECDDVMMLDAAGSKERPGSEFQQLTVFRDIMNATNRRFKIVFTGLHSVQRFTRIPNSPLPHFGNPNCIGPLPPKAASDLVRMPMESLGLKFQEPVLINKILAYTNYHPSLIQVFCEEILASLPSKLTGLPQLPIILDQDIIIQTYNKPDLRKKLRERFDWTLKLDDRYRLIGYTVAFWELGATQRRPGTGIRVADILGEVRTAWPEAFKKMETEELVSLLEEMVGLGLLSKVGSVFGSMYRLRSPNVIHLLGGEEQILEVLAEYATKPYTPTGRFDHRAKLKNNQPDPLVVAQHNTIKSAQTGMVLIVGTRALGLDRVQDSLASIADEYHFGFKIGVEKIKGSLVQDIHNFASKRNMEMKAGGLILWLDGRETPQPAEVLIDLHGWLLKLHADKKFVKVVALIEATDFLDIQADLARTDIFKGTFTQILFLERWTQANLEDWYHQINLAPDQHPPVEETISQTGGWDGLVMPKLTGVNTPSLADPGYAIPDLPNIREIINNFISFASPLSPDDYWDLFQTPEGEKDQCNLLLNFLTNIRVLCEDDYGALSIEPGLLRYLSPPA